MLKIQSLLQNFLGAMRKISKKAYKNSVIITTGCVVVAVIALNAKDFGGGGKNNVTAMVPVITEEDKEEDDLEAKVLTALDEQQFIGDISSLDIGEQVSEENETIIQKAGKEIKETTLVTQAPTENVQDQLLHISQEDYEALLRIVEAEATGEDVKGKILVANVVLNRVNSEEFPDSIYDVVHDKNGGIQFSPIADGRYYSVNITDSTREAVERALKGEDYSEGALFFVARRIASSNAVSWFDQNLTKVVQHGVHEFYKY